jgi:hypothetical protein
MNQYDEDGLSELEKVGITINELDSNVLKVMLKKKKMYRFVRSGNDIFVSNNKKEHKDILAKFSLDENNISDGGFFMIRDSEVLVYDHSNHLSGAGILSKDDQFKAHPETVTVLERKMNTANLSYGVRVHQ